MCQGLSAKGLGWEGSVCPPCPRGLLPGSPPQHRHRQLDLPHARGLLKRDWRAVGKVNCSWDYLSLLGVVSSSCLGLNWCWDERAAGKGAKASHERRLWWSKLDGQLWEELP